MCATAAGSELEMKWVRLAQAGDRQAFAELVRLHWEGVAGLVYRLYGNRNLAEDAAQDTFIKAWLNLPGYQPRASLRSWLYRIAVNQAIDLLRREKPAEDVDALDPPDTGKSPEAQTVINEDRTRVQKAVLSLPPASRSVLILREFDGLSYKEISDALDIPLGTVMSRLNLARQKLMVVLREDLETA